MAESDTKVPDKYQTRERCIHFWERMLFHNGAFMSPETRIFITDTIRHLKGEINAI